MNSVLSDIELHLASQANKRIVCTYLLGVFQVFIGRSRVKIFFLQKCKGLLIYNLENSRNHDKAVIAIFT